MTAGNLRTFVSIWTFLRQNTIGSIGIFLLIAFTLIAVMANVIAAFSPLETDFSRIFIPPNEDYWFGTDQYGRDLFSRIVHGSRTALLIGFTAAFFSTTIGLILGVASAYIGGYFDLILQRFVDLLIAFPGIVLALAMISIFGTALPLVILFITFVLIPGTVRIVRSAALGIGNSTYIDAAKAMGYSPIRIVLRHITPNVMGVYLIIVTSKAGQAILLEASLSYLGLGVQEPYPAWGLMLKNGVDQGMEAAFWVSFCPGAAITLTVLACGFFGNSLRDTLDPRLRRQ